MSISSGDILRIAVSMLFTDGNLAMNVFNAVVSGGGGPWDPLDIVADAIEWMDDVYGTMTTAVTNTLDGSFITVYVWDPVDEDWDEVGADSFTWNPTGATDSLPRGVAALINAKSTDADVNGKKYIAGMVESAATDGQWTGPTITTLAAWAVEWIVAFVGGTTGADWQPGIWSPHNLVFEAMSGTYTIPIECAYQRRRKRGVGA
jgi:hypothetical protein